MFCCAARGRLWWRLTTAHIDGARTFVHCPHRTGGRARPPRAAVTANRNTRRSGKPRGNRLRIFGRNLDCGHEPTPKQGPPPNSAKYAKPQNHFDAPARARKTTSTRWRLPALIATHFPVRSLPFLDNSRSQVRPQHDSSDPLLPTVSGERGCEAAPHSPTPLGEEMRS